MFDSRKSMGQHHRCPARTHLVREGDANERCFLLLDGLIAQEKFVQKNDRQIVALHGPRDVCGLSALADEDAKCDLVALSPISFFAIERDALMSIALDSPAVCRAMLRQISREAAISMTWIANIGRRPAYQRLAHLFCELEARMGASGQMSDDGFEWPGTQADLGAATGLSLVHVNKTLRKMEADRLISCRRRLKVQDAKRLADAAGFDSKYLALDRENLGAMLLSRIEAMRSHGQFDLPVDASIKPAAARFCSADLPT